MALSLFQVKSFLSYWLEAIDEHSLHSPFFFDFYVRHIRPAVGGSQFEHIESLRRKLLHDRRTLRVSDPGSGATRNALRKISQIARTSLSTARYSTLYYRMASAMRATLIVELGTSLGINTLYLAENREATVFTFEGAPEIADIAASVFEVSGSKNIQLVRGNIDKTLPAFLENARRVDFALLDANHRYDATIRYFEWLSKKMHVRGVLVIDDIHQSPEMERAWKVIKDHQLVYGSADLFRCGILFFDPSLNNQHVILQV